MNKKRTVGVILAFFCLILAASGFFFVSYVADEVGKDNPIVIFFIYFWMAMVAGAGVFILVKMNTTRQRVDGE